MTDKLSREDVLKVAGEPVAILRVKMHTHDMGQSLAPNKAFKAAIASAKSVAGSCQLGDYDLYTEAQLLAVAEAMYAVGAETMREQAAHFVEDKFDFVGGEIEVADAIRALPITTNTEGEQGCEKTT